MKEDLNRHSIKNQSYFSDTNMYLFVSFLLGILLGLATLSTGIRYIYAPWPAHGPVGVIGAFLVIIGSVIFCGSILVLKKKTVIVGALLILVPGLIFGPQGLMPFVLHDLVAFLLGWGSPIASFILAFYGRKL